MPGQKHYMVHDRKVKSNYTIKLCINVTHLKAMFDNSISIIPFFSETTPSISANAEIHLEIV